MALLAKQLQAQADQVPRWLHEERLYAVFFISLIIFISAGIIALSMLITCTAMVSLYFLIPAIFLFSLILPAVFIFFKVNDLPNKLERIQTEIANDTLHIKMPDEDFEKLVDDVLTLKNLSTRLTHHSFKILQFIILNNKLSPLQRAYLEERIALANSQATDYLTSRIVIRNDNKDTLLQKFKANLQQLIYLLSLTTPPQTPLPPNPVIRDFGTQANTIATSPTPVQEKDKSFILAWLYYKEGRTLYKSSLVPANPAPATMPQPQGVLSPPARTERECYQLALTEIKKIPEEELTAQERYLKSKIEKNLKRINRQVKTSSAVTLMESNEDSTIKMAPNKIVENQEPALWLLHRAKEELALAQEATDAKAKATHAILAATYARRAFRALNPKYDKKVNFYELPTKKEKIKTIFNSLLNLNLNETIQKQIRYQQTIASLSINSLIADEKNRFDNFCFVLQDSYLNPQLKQFILNKFHAQLKTSKNATKKFELAALFIQWANDFLKIDVVNMDIFNSVYEKSSEGSLILSSKNPIKKRFVVNDDGRCYEHTGAYTQHRAYLEEGQKLLLSTDQPQDKEEENTTQSSEEGTSSVEFNAQYQVLQFQEDMFDFAVRVGPIHLDRLVEQSKGNQEYKQELGTYNLLLAKLLKSYYKAYEIMLENKNTLSKENDEAKALFEALSTMLATYVCAINPEYLSALPIFRDRNEWHILTLHLLLQTHNKIYDQTKTQVLLKQALSSLQYDGLTKITIKDSENLAGLVKNYLDFFNCNESYSNNTSLEKNDSRVDESVKSSKEEIEDPDVKKGSPILTTDYFGTLNTQTHEVSYKMTFISLEQLCFYLEAVKTDLAAEISQYSDSLNSTQDEYVQRYKKLDDQLLKEGKSQPFDFIKELETLGQARLISYSPIEQKRKEAQELLMEINTLLKAAVSSDLEGMQDSPLFLMIYQSENLRQRLEKKIGQAFMIIETIVKTQLQAGLKGDSWSFAGWGKKFAQHADSLISKAEAPTSENAEIPKETDATTEDTTETTIVYKLKSTFNNLKKERCYKKSASQTFFDTHRTDNLDEASLFEWLLPILKSPILKIEHKIQLFNFVNTDLGICDVNYSSENFDTSVERMDGLAVL